MDWSDGYVSGIDYTYGYYPELNPLQARLKLLNAGIKPPKIKTACELGFGQGISILAHASSSDIDWYGNDFNPNHVSFAKNIADKVGLSLQPSDDNFETFCSRDDLPMFDFIGLHGIWSWVSEENRSFIREFIRKKLNVGGIVYLSYNTTAGRSPVVPIRNLLLQHSKTQSAPGLPMHEKISGAIQFLNNLLEVDPAFKKANSHAVEIFKTVIEKNPEYLAHEYFNEDWTLMSFSDVCKILIDCKLTYAVSGNALDALPQLSFTNEQLVLLDTIKDPTLREDVKDFCLNRDFRRDFWIKGVQRLSDTEKNHELGLMRIILVKSPSEISLEIDTARGPGKLSEDVYTPIISLLNNHSSIQISDIARQLEARLSFKQLVEAILVLNKKNYVQLVQDEGPSKQRKTQVKNFNSYFIEKSRVQAEITILLSPVTGSCVPASRFDQLFTLAALNKCKRPEEFSRFVWDIINANGQRLLKDGVVLETEAENLDEMLIMANEFLATKFQIFKRLEII